MSGPFGCRCLPIRSKNERFRDLASFAAGSLSDLESATLQMAHNRFYFLRGCLVCKRETLAKHPVDAHGPGEQGTLVMAESENQFSLTRAASVNEGA